MENTVINKAFAQDVREGLTAENKFLSSKYFYDATGDKLFQKIMQLPEYYLTRAEYEILERYHADILKPFVQRNEKFNLVEMGSGDGLKTRLLLKHLYERQIPFHYYPVDISGSSLTELRHSLKSLFPNMSIHPIEGHYLKALEEHRWDARFPTLMVFLGSNLGNFLEKEAKELLSSLARALKYDELLLAGFDLKKDPEIILDAYNDSQKVTRDFNLNVLARINRELGGEFNLSKFKHWPLYDPVTGECKSFLISTEKQRVNVAALEETFTFEKAEAIFTEVSKKYSLPELERFAHSEGFEIIQNFLDRKEYFTTSLWRKA